MSPSHYEDIMDALEDYVLFFEAEKRFASANKEYISSGKVLADLGLNDSDLDDVEVEIE
jgi:hypothetical protein